MRSRRPGTAALLAGAAVALLISIWLGQRLGDRVLLQATQRRAPAPGVLATPVADAQEARATRYWKRLQVVSVATDPAFPDPRVTPTPAPPPTPPPRVTPRPEITLPPTAPPNNQNPYTSPPLPIPLVSHPPEETSTEPPAAGVPPPGSQPTPPAR